jgi:hypothetical protein
MEVIYLGKFQTPEMIVKAAMEENVDVIGLSCLSPNHVRLIPKMMDHLRQKALKEKKANPKAREIIAFHKSFLDSIKYTGRLYEIGLFADYKTRTLKILDDLALAPKMMKRGKLNIFPELIKDRSGIASIFRKTKTTFFQRKSSTF